MTATDALARSLAIRTAEIMDRYDPVGYADAIADYDGNEEYLLEDYVGQIASNPKIFISNLLDLAEQMMDDIEMRC